MFEDEQITDSISHYFQQIFTSISPPATEVVNKALTPCISASTNELLISLPSASKVKAALFGIHPDKAPGPDGFSASFFQSNWNVVGPAIIKEIQIFFGTGSLPSTINSTHIRLIQKSKVLNKCLIIDLLPYVTSTTKSSQKSLSTLEASAKGYHI